jgi:hypothetical protein
MADMDIIELSDLDFSGGGDFDQKKTTNFGGGLEFLMNDKIKDGMKPSSDIDLEDLNNLENELNNLADEMPNNDSSFRPKSDLFNTQGSLF